MVKQTARVGSALVVVASFLSALAFGPSLSIALRTALAAALAGIAAALYSYLYRQVSHNRPGFIAYAGLGIVFGLVFGFGLAAAEFIDSPVGVVVMTVAMCLGAIWWGTSSLARQGVDDFDPTYQGMVDTVVDLELLAISTSRLTRQARLAPRVDSRSQAVDEGSTSVLDLNDLWAVSASLRDAADERTLRERLRTAAAQSYPSPHGHAIITQLPDEGFAPLVIAIVLTAVYLPMSLNSPTIAPILFGLVAAATMWTTNMVAQRTAIRANLAYSIGFLLLEVESVAVLTLDNDPLTWTRAIAVALLTALVVLASSVIRTLYHLQDACLGELRTIIHTQRVIKGQELQACAEQIGDATRTLSGASQVHLMAAVGCTAAASLVLMDDGGPVSKAQALVDEAANACESAYARSATLPSLVQQACDPWEGLVDIDVVIGPHAGGIDDHSSSLVAKVVQEAITNACRHGLAENISVGIGDPHGEPARVTVTVRDDGRGPQQGSPGLGWALFDQASAGAFRHVSDGPDGSLMEVDVLVHVADTSA